jgi:serine/threonine protein kinase
MKVTPRAQVVPTLDPLGLDLLKSMLRYEPSTRISAKAALQHPYFADIEHLYALQLRL